MRISPSSLKLTLCVAAALGSVARPTFAQEITLGPRGNTVFVWKDGDAMSEGFSLIQAKVHEKNPALVMQLISCAVKPGTKAIITDGGFATQTIVITDGEFAGCRGDIVTEDLKR